MRRQLLGWTGGICLLIVVALAGGAVIMLPVITRIVSWHALSEPTRRAIKRPLTIDD
jgi:hypothetical protein